ncbi:conserved domain protein [Yersinia pestis biovar Antiqua str. B42003004]|nr:conserved domain protein [Yersinia pestis biovar Antiqua str. B42003004]
MAFYLQDNSPSQIETLISDIAEFTAAYPNTLDDELNTRWGDDFSPELWGTTPQDFLHDVQNLALQHQG